MKKLLIPAIIFTFFSAGFTLVDDTKESKSANAVKKGRSEVKWLSFEEAQKLSEKNPKKVFIDVYTDWCGWCKKMDKTTLKDPIITEYLDKKFYAVKLNAESDKKITYKGKEITERQLATNIFKATGYPTTVYLDENLTLLQPISSYLEVEMLDKILHYYGEDFYKKTSWDTFESVYSTKPSN